MSGLGELKTHTNIFRFDITSDKQFQSLANAFTHALRAVEQQGYAVEYHGRMLYHPGQIGVRGISGIGKSEFFNTVMSAFLPSDVESTERLQPSADEKRMVQVWKQWLLKGSQKEYRIEDILAVTSLAHLTDTQLPSRDWAGVSIFEHIDDRTEFCDIVMELLYDDNGHRIAQISTTDAVAQSKDFSSGFLPQVRDITL